MTNLFTRRGFTSHSGRHIPFKIDCDALTDDDIECIAEYIASKTTFGLVEEVSRGGFRLAKALVEYARWESPFNILLVDDVLTTGNSMEKAKTDQPPQVHEDDVIGWVIFARGRLPNWVRAVFMM